MSEGSGGGTAHAVDVREMIDNARLGGIQLTVILVCFATAVADGLDNQAIGFASPAIAAGLGIPLSSFGVIFAAGLIGGLVGAMFFGTVADRIGRKSALLVCTVLFAVFTLLTAFAQGSAELIAYRLLAGLGLGGAMPCFLTMVSEYTPKHCRALVMAILWCGYPAGGMIGGAIGSYLLPVYGWQSIFILGGVLAVVVGLLQLLLLPESILFLVLRGAPSARIASIARRVSGDATLSADTAFVAEAPKKPAKIPVMDLFTEGRHISTALLWLIMFSTFMITNFFVLWSPALLQRGGFTLSQTALLIALLNLFNLPSQAFSGYMIDRIGPFKLLPIGFLSLAVAIVILTYTVGFYPGAIVAMGLIGFLQGPGIAGSVFMATRIYPAHIRSTGAGWGTGIGRAGQVFGSLAIGAIVNWGMQPRDIFLLMVIPPVVGMIAVFILGRQMGRATL